MALFADRAAGREAEAADRVRQIAEKYKEYGIDQMPVSQVLDLLSPAGRWAREPVKIGGEGPDPRVDPITGCLPVTPSA